MTEFKKRNLHVFRDEGRQITKAIKEKEERRKKEEGEENEESKGEEISRCAEERDG